MLLYLIRRLAWAAVVILCVTAVTFAIFYLLPPGDPAARFAGRSPSPELIATIRHNLGLDKPWYVQYFKFVKSIVTGDQYGWPGLGYSYGSSVPIRDKIIEKAPRTFSLIIGAAVLWLVMGIGIGVLSAVKRRSFFDRFAMGFALFGISAPVFWLGLMALFIFWYKLDLTAGTGYVAFTDSPLDWASHLILPWTVLALLYAATYARMVRGSLLDTLGEDFIRTARAKGLSERRVIFGHGLRASLAPIVTMFGLDTALLVGGAVITESVFNLDGLGFMAIDSVFRQDLPAVLGVVLLGTFAVVMANLLVDIAYAFLDPRVRYA
jgi:peptide/nickel transport system permease protein